MSISVVIPAYNASRYIAETLESVLAQTLRPDEVVVVDDGSTDGTGEIAATFPAPVRVVRIPNSKVSAARNIGVQHASGEWIAFMDADDLWRADKLELQMRAVAQYPKAGLSYTGRMNLEQVGESFRPRKIVETPPAGDLPSWLQIDTSFPPSSVLIRRSTFLASGGFDTRMKYAEDWDLWLRLFRSGCTFVDCPEPLLIYRVHNCSSSTDAMGILDGVRHVYRTYIVPELSPVSRLYRHGRFWSRHEAEAAFALRRQRDSRCLGMMARSIVHWPFGNSHRYTVLLHMAYSRARGWPKKR